jgi:endoglucanase
MKLTRFLKNNSGKNILMSSIVLPVLSILFFSLFVERFIISGGDEQQRIIKINQSGYRPGDSKVAFVTGTDPQTFEVINASTNEKVFSGEANNPMTFDRATGDNVYALDFSAIMIPGDYTIFIPSLSETSFKFSIRNNVYDECAVKTLESFYYQRCGTEVNNGTVWKHSECHLKPSLFYDDPAKEMNTAGGWHDAGDYNKFVPSTAVSAAFLLYAFEDNENYFFDGQLNIPESDNSIPDILDEAIWSLKWLLKMQKEDGGIYHKVSIKKWTAENLPDKETDKQYIFRVSSTSTAGAAAAAALGARLLNEYDKQLSSRLLKYAVKAWNFLTKNPGNIPPGGFKNPPDVSGGEYGDDNDSDERLWASIELFRLTGSEEYLAYFLSNYKKVGGPNYTISWKNTANFAYYSFLKLNPLENIEARTNIIANINIYSNELLKRTEAGGFKCILNTNEYYWGSNSVAAGYAFDLINIYFVTNHHVYRNAALDQLHYLLGRNTFGISFVTGLGTNPVKYPYHQFSMLKHKGNPVPGMLVGGPNSYSRLNGKIIDEMPGKCYEDNEKNYYVNEVAINYTAPLVYVASFFSSMDNNGNKKTLTKE